jgi:dTDP-glucose pyrophosphorylase
MMRSSPSSVSIEQKERNMTTAIITMAGFGRRFAHAGYAVPKYRIEVHGRPLFSWAMLSLRSFIDAGTPFVFAVREDKGAGEFIQREAGALGIRAMEIVQLSEPTDGQATTAMAARPAVANPAQPMFIYNIDTFVHPSALLAESVRGEGWIPCFPAEGDAWSFAAADESGRVREVREKERISSHATVGLYWFSSFDLYADLYARYYSNPLNLEKGERYVAPLYNALIAAGQAVYIHDVPLAAVTPLGVPCDVERFRSGSSPQLSTTSPHRYAV